MRPEEFGRMGVTWTQRLTISGKDAEQVVKQTGDELCLDKLFDCEGDADTFYEKFHFLSPNLDDNGDNYVISPWKKLEGEELEHYWEERDDGTFEEDPEEPWEEGEQPEWDVKGNFKTDLVYSCTVQTHKGSLIDLQPELHKKFELFESHILLCSLDWGKIGEYCYWVWMDDDEPDCVEGIDFRPKGAIASKDQLTKQQWEYVEQTLCSMYKTFDGKPMTPEGLRDEFYDSFEEEYTPVKEMFPEG